MKEEMYNIISLNSIVIPRLKVTKVRQDYYAIIIPSAFNEYVVNKNFICYLKLGNNIIPLGPKKVSKFTNKNYCIFLPKHFIELWKTLHEKKETLDLILILG